MSTLPTITIRDGITLTNFPEAVKKQVKKKLEVTNDVYYMLKKKKKDVLRGELILFISFISKNGVN